MNKKTNLNEENYFNMCGCSSSFDGNKGYGFPKDEDYDNGYNTPSYSNASGVDFDGDDFDTWSRGKVLIQQEKEFVTYVKIIDCR